MPEGVDPGLDGRGDGHVKGWVIGDDELVGAIEAADQDFEFDHLNSHYVITGTPGHNGDAEVAEQDLVLVAQQYVFRFDVAMDQFAGLCGLPSAAPLYVQ